MSIWRKYGFAWVTLSFFLFSLVLHWLFGWLAHVDEQAALGQAPDVAAWLNEMLRDTFENWQSEFLQLLWQVAGLAVLLHVGSPQSKEEGDRVEDKIDALLRAVDPDKAEALIRSLDRRYPGRDSGLPPGSAR
jgi:hypothetical protein